MKNFRFLSSLALGAALVLAPLGLAAQEHGHAAQPAHGEAPKAAEAHQAPEAHKAEAHDGHAQPAHGEAHKGGEAHGASEAHGGGHHSGVDWKAEIFRLVNFALFAAGIWLLIGVGKKAAFQKKAQDIEHRLRQAERDKAEGEAQIRDLETRMAGLQQELEGLVSKAEADAEAEKTRVVEAARQEASMIVAQAGAEIAFKQKQAELELRALVAQLAAEAAAQRIQSRIEGEASKVLDKAIREIGNQGVN